MRSILKQSSWLMAAQAFGRIIGFFYTIYIARVLGVENFGLYSVALAYFSLISTVAEFGFNRFITREVALSTHKIAVLLCNISIYRLTIASVIFGALSLILYFLDQDKMRVNLTVLAILATLPVAVAQTIDAIFVALRKLQFSAIALVIQSLVTTGLGIILVNLGFGPTGVLVALIIGQLIYLAILLSLIFRQKLNLLSEVKLSVLKEVTIGALPYGIIGILGLLYFRVDTLLLSYLRGNFDTGIYGAAYKFLEAAMFIPISVSIAIFPVMAKLQEELASLRKLHLKTTSLMFAVGVFFTIIFLVILPTLIRSFLPNYLNAIDAARILSLAIPFMFVHVTGAQVILASNKYLKHLIALSFLPLIFNIFLNLLFIPRFGYIGAAWITVLSDVFSMFILYAFLHLYFFKHGQKRS